MDLGVNWLCSKRPWVHNDRILKAKKWVHNSLGVLSFGQPFEMVCDIQHCKCSLMILIFNGFLSAICKAHCCNIRTCSDEIMNGLITADGDTFPGILNVLIFMSLISPQLGLWSFGTRYFFLRQHVSCSLISLCWNRANLSCSQGQPLKEET